MKVKNIMSNKRNAIPNQFSITDDNGAVYYQSYDSIICKRATDGKIFLDAEKWDYSQTTGKYRNIWLGEDKKTTEQKIKNGVYTLMDLNLSQNQ